MEQPKIGKGTIRPRGDGAWEIKLDRPRARGAGKRKTIYERVHGTRLDAELKLAEIRKALENETFVDPSKLTVKQWLEQWLAEHAAHRVSAKTFERYAEIVRQHLVPALGAHRLRKLEGVHIQAAYGAALRARRRRTRKDGAVVDLPPLSAQTVKHCHRVLSLALKQANRLKLRAGNPAADVDPPRPKRVELAILDQAQTGELLNAAASSSIYVPVLLAATTGMRRGEVLALRWKDVDLDKGVISVAQTLEETAKEGLTFKAPKTERSRRLIPMVPFTVEPLRAHRARQGEDRLRAGTIWADHDLVCCQADGTPLRPRQVTKAFAALARSIGLKLRLHDLRHTHLSQLLAAGVNIKVVSERAGHAGVAITLDTYAHVMPGMQEDAVNRIDAALRPHLKG
jgi:integrase